MEIFIENASSNNIFCSLIGENDYKDRIEIKAENSNKFGNLKLSQSYLIKFCDDYEHNDIVYKRNY